MQITSKTTKYIMCNTFTDINRLLPFRITGISEPPLASELSFSLHIMTYNLNHDVTYGMYTLELESRVYT